jgi:tetratricopeptide (TPR) repeat protein
MMLSFDYAARQSVLASQTTSRAVAAASWAAACREAFLDGYAAEAKHDPQSDSLLLAVMEPDKGLYETVYETRHRPRLGRSLCEPWRGCWPTEPSYPLAPGWGPAGDGRGYPGCATRPERGCAMVNLRRRGRRSAAEAYNAGNAALRAGRHATAIACYTEAIELLPAFPQAYHNRAIAYANAGDELSCVQDLVEAWLLDYDTDEFWPTFFNHVHSVFLTELLTNGDLPAALGERLRSRTEEAVQRGTIFLRQFPDHSMRFLPDSLPERYWLSRLVGQRDDLDPAVFTGVFDLCCDSRWAGDDELAWRAKFLLATVLYEEYQTTEWSPDGQGGVFFEDDYLMNRPHWGVPLPLLLSLVASRLPPDEGEPAKHHLARFTLALAFDAAETLLRRRTAEPPPPRSAELNWAFAQDLFKVLIGTAGYLDDTAGTIRVVELARRVNAAFAAAAWTQGRHTPDTLLAAIAPVPDVGLQVGATRAWPGTLLVDYFLYETGGDNLVRTCLTPADDRLSQRYVPPGEVAKLVGLGAQWQDPEMFRQLRADPGVNPRPDAPARRPDASGARGRLMPVRGDRLQRSRRRRRVRCGAGVVRPHRSPAEPRRDTPAVAGGHGRRRCRPHRLSRRVRRPPEHDLPAPRRRRNALPGGPRARARPGC